LLIRRAELVGFFGITAVVDFPESGTLMVTGPNGTGKSARCYDAPAWAAWKQTIRGTPPQAKFSTVPASVALTTDKVEIIRSTKHGLTWNHVGHEPVVYETPTKTAEALERVLGDMDVWQRTHVFRTRDTGLFTNARDGDRKRLLERLIGLDVFDNAYSIVQKKHSVRNEALEKLLMKKQQLETRIDETKRHALDLKSFASKELREPDDLRTKMSELAAQRSDKQKAYQDAHSEIVSTSALVSLTTRQQVQHTDGRCYACQQEIPPSVIEKQAVDLAEAKRLATEAEYHNRGRMQDAARALGELDIELRQLQEELSQASVHAMASTKMAALKARFTADRNELSDTQLDLDFLREDEEVAAHGLRFLGIRGPRSIILNAALRKLEERTNTYLTWLNTSTRIRINGLTEQANGKTANKINIEVEGWGGGHGYDACSGGQQRRLDLVVLLALASLSESQGTLFFDEAFDALDQEGAESASELLSRMSENRPVVIIAHNPTIIKTVRGSRLDLNVGA